MATNIEAALTEIDDRIAALDAERAQLDQARVTLRGLIAPSLPFVKPAPLKATPPRSDAPTVANGQAVLDLLREGPKRTGEIAAALDVDPHTARGLLATLLKERAVKVEGATQSRRWSLAATGARNGGKPKEAVQ